MENFQAVKNEKAYQLLNSGGLIIVCTVSSEGIYNMAPIAWHCPVDYDKTTRLLFVSDLQHKTYANIIDTKKFVIALPSANQVEMVKELGSCSGHKVNKIEHLHLSTFESPVLKIALPLDCIAYLECNLHSVVMQETVGIVLGDVINAFGQKDAYKGRLLSENLNAKTIHHLGSNNFITTADKLL
ncbi:MAG TPA: flavin reductase family protein [Bacteroidales bacterium]|nr:flavin reductase family protein [Bacteroidales bacterium]